MPRPRLISHEIRCFDSRKDTVSPVSTTRLGKKALLNVSGAFLILSQLPLRPHRRPTSLASRVTLWLLQRAGARALLTLICGRFYELIGPGGTNKKRSRHGKARVSGSCGAFVSVTTSGICCRSSRVCLSRKYAAAFRATESPPSPPSTGMSTIGKTRREGESPLWQ